MMRLGSDSSHCAADRVASNPDHRQTGQVIRWHRKGFQLFWRWKSRPRGRPRVPADLQQLIAEIAAANHTWGEERIAAELQVKLGIGVSPRTVRRELALECA